MSEKIKAAVKSETTKIKVKVGNYFAGKFAKAGAVLDLTPRQLACAVRRNREFDEVKPAKKKVAKKKASSEDMLD